MFEVKFLPVFVNIMVGAFGVGSICLMNFSLHFNSIGFYQMLKLLVVPCCLVINAVMYREYASSKVKLTLLLVISGVGAATVTDLELNFKGCVVGLLAVAITAQFQIWQGQKQKEYGLTGNQLACSAAFAQIFIGGFMALLFEGRDVVAFVTTQETSTLYYLGLMIAMSCILAVCVNVHSFALIGKTSAVTFQVVGHGKTCLILMAGYYSHIQSGGDWSSLQNNLIGVSIAMMGVVLYSNVKLMNEHGDWCDILTRRFKRFRYQSIIV